MHLMITLLLAHLLADFPLQTNTLARLKRSSAYGVFLHVLIHIAITTILLRNPLDYLPLILGLGVAHFAIDLLKIYSPLKNEVVGFLVDQLLHLVSIGVTAYLAHLVWTLGPVSILVDDVLVVAVTCSSLLALMVFCWVWTNTLDEEIVQQHQLLHWVKCRVLMLEQKVGALLLLALMATQVLKQ